MNQSELEQIIVDGQILSCPNLEQWLKILHLKTFNGVSIEWIKEKIIRNSEYPIIKSCITIYKKRISYYELLYIEGKYYRVFIERIVCDHCGNRAKISATPGVIDSYIGLDSINQEMAIKRYRTLPNLSCPNCSRIYDRRYTIWQINNLG